MELLKMNSWGNINYPETIKCKKKNTAGEGN